MAEPTLALLQPKVLRAALILGTKYDFERYKTMALDHLETLFPQTLHQWDAVQSLHPWYEGAELRFLELVRSFGRSTMLPSAYYLAISQGCTVSSPLIWLICVPQPHCHSVRHSERISSKG